MHDHDTPKTHLGDPKHQEFTSAQFNSAQLTSVMWGIVRIFAFCLFVPLALIIGGICLIGYML